MRLPPNLSVSFPSIRAQDWEVTAAFSFESQSDIFDPEIDYLKNQTGSTPWRKLSRDEVLGIVFMQRATGIRDEDLNNKVAYARTTLESAEEKTVTLSVGSDDWIQGNDHCRRNSEGANRGRIAFSAAAGVVQRNRRLAKPAERPDYAQTFSAFK